MLNFLKKIIINHFLNYLPRMKFQIKIREIKLRFMKNQSQSVKIIKKFLSIQIPTYSHKKQVLISHLEIISMMRK